MLRESEAETEACGRWSSSVVFAGGIWRKTVPPSSTCGEMNGRMIPHCGASTATTAASTPFPSLPRPAGCEIDKDREARRGAEFLSRVRANRTSTARTVGGRRRPPRCTRARLRRRGHPVHMSGWTAGIGRGRVARRNAGGPSGHT